MKTFLSLDLRNMRTPQTTKNDDEDDDNNDNSGGSDDDNGDDAASFYTRHGFLDLRCQHIPVSFLLIKMGGRK